MSFYRPCWLTPSIMGGQGPWTLLCLRGGAAVRADLALLHGKTGVEAGLAALLPLDLARAERTQRALFTPAEDTAIVHGVAGPVHRPVGIGVSDQVARRLVDRERAWVGGRGLAAQRGALDHHGIGEAVAIDLALFDEENRLRAASPRSCGEGPTS